MGRFESGFADDIEKMIQLKVAMNFSENTYLERAQVFDRFCKMRFPELSVINDVITLEWIKDALDTSTRNVAHSRLAFIRTLGEYQKALGKNPYIPPKGMLNHGSVFVPYIFTDEELSDLFCVIDEYQNKSQPFEGIIFSMYFRLTYTCGLRPFESRVLKRVDVDINSGEIRIVNSKWNKSRSIIMSDEIRLLARIYAAKRDLLYPDSEFFFPSPDGGVYSTAKIQSRFKKFYELSRPDVPKELLPAVRVYDLRHRFATAVMNKWLDEKIDLKARLPYLQMYMGHHQIESTAYYIHLLPEKLVKSAGIEWDKLNAVIPEVETWEG